MWFRTAAATVGRSRKSRDGGASWQQDGLGQRGEIDGEYCIRLSLDRHHQQGVFRSAAIDVTGSGSDEIHRGAALEVCLATWEVAGEGGGAAAPAEVKVRVRFSDTPVLDAGEGWSAWEAVQGLDGKWMPPAGRWLQFEVTLGTDNPLLSAALRSITVEAQTKPIGRLNPHAWRYEDLPQLERDADGEIVLLGPYDEPRREGHCLLQLYPHRCLSVSVTLGEYLGVRGPESVAEVILSA